MSQKGLLLGRQSTESLALCIFVSDSEIIHCCALPCYVQFSYFKLANMVIDSNQNELYLKLKLVRHMH